MKRILKSNKTYIIQKLLELRAAGLTQQAAAKTLGFSRSSINSLCSRQGIIGWPQGAAARDQRGDKNPAFVNGVSRASVARATKKVIIDNGRDLFTCERCGTKRDIELPRHHKDRNRANNTNDNIEVLCVPCHNKEHMPERTRDKLGRLECNTKSV